MVFSSLSSFDSSLGHCSVSLGKMISTPQISLIESESSRHSEEEVVDYHLQNKPIHVLGSIGSKVEGLGKNTTLPQGGKGRGRQSHLSKVQNRALIDMETRKQISIFGALSTSNSLEEDF